MAELLMIPLHLIDAAGRLRPVDPAHVEVIAASMRLLGLQQPVTVRPTGNRYQLVAGAHRLAAAQRLGWSDIGALPADLSDDEARLVEIDENLMRRELSALDRALSLAQRKAVYDRLHPETTRPGRRKKELSQTLRQFGERFSKDAARRTGLSERAVQMSLELAANLTPEARDLLRLSDLADNQAQLLQLAGIEDAAEQLAVAREIAEGRARSPAQARIALGLEAPVAVDPQEQVFAQFLALWARAEPATRQRIGEHIASLGKPARGKSKSGAAS